MIGLAIGLAIGLGVRGGLYYPVPRTGHDSSSACHRLWRRRDGRRGGLLPGPARRRGHGGGALGRGLRGLRQVRRLPGARLVRRVPGGPAGPGELRAPRRAGARARIRLWLSSDGYLHAGRAREGGGGGRAPDPRAALDRRPRHRGGRARLSRDDGPGPPRPLHHRAARRGPGARGRAAEGRGRGRDHARPRGERRHGGRPTARG